MEIFNDAEKVELEKINENPVLLSALRKIFLSDIYQNGTITTDEMDNSFRRNFAFSLSFDETGRELARTNEDLGKALRACNEALRIVSIAFDKISKYKKVVNINIPKGNKAR